jgi:hypothetical protein
MSYFYNKVENWIFVTGIIRSGTTFVGTSLSIPKEVDYIHEPFNPLCGLPGIKDWYPYVRSNPNDPRALSLQPMAESIFDYSLQLRNWVPKIDPLHKQFLKAIVGGRGPYCLRLAKLNPFHKSAVIKDPIGVLLTEYLYCNFNIQPVIVIKHPTSLIASLKRVNWWPSPRKITGLSNLIDDYFPNDSSCLEVDFEDDISAAAAYWKAVHYVLLKQAQKHKDWKIVILENLSQDPVSSFESLYSELQLPWSPRVKTKIVSLTQKSKSAKAKKGRVQDFNRDSAKIFESNRNSLTIDERKKIFEIVKDVALEIYPKESFAID